ncbi:MAG: asparagine synthase B [Sphaerochaetaceae bacterium]
MCGFVGMFDVKGDTAQYRTNVLDMSRKIRHRGPDWSGIYTGPSAIIGHERLAIVDPLSGKQPLYSKDGKLVLAVNGEIYNHRELRLLYDGYHGRPAYEFLTNSDCEIILALYRDKGCALFEELNGIFAFALYDVEQDAYLIGRDHIGIIPLYQGWDGEGHYYVASELKALDRTCAAVEEFLPGHYFYSKETHQVQWYHREWKDYEAVKHAPIDEKAAIAAVRDSLEHAVKRQLMTDVPYGVLLSGGLDSSIIAAVTARFAERRVETNDSEMAWWPRLHSFAIGLEGSPDLKAARIAAKAIGTVHHEVHFTIQEAIDAVSDVIYHLETFDITTVRAATPMYLLARVIRSMGIKMVLSGEGSDELFGGYLYFHKAPDAFEFHEETVRKLGKLHLYDCLRANKALAAWGVEGRVPFLDKEFMDVAMSLNPVLKMSKTTDGSKRIEKWLLRKAFEDLLPNEIVWRQKEQFSDGVGYRWIDSIKAYAAEQVTDEQFAVASKRFAINTPSTKEEYLYRAIFASHFPSESAARCAPHEASVACSTAKALEWDAAFQAMNEPSGRAVYGVHEQAYGQGKY